MAKIKTSSLLAEIRGNLGGVVFSSNGHGFYCRSLRQPTNPRTNRQSTQRNIFSDTVRTWATLSASEIAGWNTFAADPNNTRYDYFGDPYLPSGLNQFSIINILRNGAGLPMINTAPTAGVCGNLPPMQVYIDFQAAIANSYIQRMATFAPSLAYVQVKLQLWASIGKLQPPLPLKMLSIQSSGSYNPYDIQSLIDDRYGLPPSDGNWYVSLTPYTAELRSGTTKTYTARNKTSVTG